MSIEHFAFLAAAYLIGSIPFGVLIARAKGVDIMSVGSGNTGATNVYRALGRGPGILVFTLDVLKSALPAAAAARFFEDRSFAFGIGIVAVLGHSFSPWLRFKGGKGVASGLGALLGSSPLVAACALGLFGILLLAFRYLSLASIAAAVSLTVWAFSFREPGPIVAGCLGLGLFVIIRHIPNMKRLLAGTEPKFDFRGGKKSTDSAASSSPEGVDSAVRGESHP